MKQESVLGKTPDYNKTPDSDYKGKLTKIPRYYWSGLHSSLSNVWANSTLNTTTLNGATGNTYLTKLGEYANKIATTRWQVGGADWEQLAEVTAKVAYQNEVGNPVYNLTYEAKVGLMYVSDYMYAADSKQNNAWGDLVGRNYYDNSKDYSAVKDYNWMSLGTHEWTISRYSDISTNAAFYVNATGCVDGGGVNGSSAVRPSFSLLNSVAYSGGTGTEADPIRIN